MIVLQIVMLVHTAARTVMILSSRKHIPCKLADAEKAFDNQLAAT